MGLESFATQIEKPTGNWRAVGISLYFIGIYWGLNGDLFVGIVSFHMRPGPLWQVWT
jgi:hypothetical protein